MAKSLKQASKKSIYDAKVASMEMGTDIGEFIQEEGLSVIENCLGDFVERVHYNINKEKDFVTTGKISELTIQAVDGAVCVMANKHLIFQDLGVNGSVNKLYPDSPFSYSDKRPPVQVFIDMIKAKKIHLDDNEKYSHKKPPFKELTEEKRIEQAAYGMRENVFKNGFRPRKIFQKEYPKLIEDLQEQIADFCVSAITQVIDVKPSAKRIITN